MIDPECSCVMTESSQANCRVHGTDEARKRPPAWFGPALVRAQRIDEFNRVLPALEADNTPILMSVVRDVSYANPPFEHVNDYAAEL